jgi:hypothetical protein
MIEKEAIGEKAPESRAGLQAFEGKFGAEEGTRT